MKIRLILLMIMALLGFGSGVFAQFDNSDESEALAEKPRTEVSRSDIEELSKARKSKNEDMMVRAASRVLSVDPKNLVALNALGVFYFEQNKLGMAKIIFSRALADHSDVAALHNNLGIVYLAENKQRQAISSFKKAMELKSSYGIGSANLGSIYIEYLDYKRAVDSLESGYKATRNDLKSGSESAVEVANNYAVALAGSGQTSDAKKVFKEILDKNEKKADVLLNYASLLVERLKDKSEGQKVIGRLKFITDDPKDIKKVEELEAKLGSKE